MSLATPVGGSTDPTPPTVEVGPVTTEGSTIRCPIACDESLRRFFAGETFVADYDVDVEAVPESVAVVPVLAHVCPVAWANGADVRVAAADAEYVDSLRIVGRELVDMYPTFMQGGRVLLGETVENDATADGGAGSARNGDGDGGAAMLFSGGVDSMATYLRHRSEEPALVCVQGWVLGRDRPERWERVWGRVARFADERGVRSHAISSNMLDVLDTPMLQAHYQRYVDGAWYSSVGHGLGMIGLCAPLAYAAGYGTLYMAATHTEAFGVPWGSHPRIDDRIRWSGTRAVHDGYELSRQEKVELIADYVRTGDDGVTLRTCIHSETGGNCSRCEKCYRTIVGLVLAGLDPNELGYDVDGSTFDEIRSALARGAFTMGDDERFMWKNLQEHVPAGDVWTDRGAGDGDAGGGRPPWPEAEAFFDWLRTADIDALVDGSKRPLLDRVVQAGMRHAPYPLYAGVYAAYDRARRIARSR